MNWYKLDLHIHTALSPCTSDEMTPANIVQMAELEDLRLIAITDHNSSYNCEAVIGAAQGKNVKVLYGMEVQTKEEVHVLTLLPTKEAMDQWQANINQRMAPIPSKSQAFGRQLVFDAQDTPISEYPYVLQQALEYTLEDLAYDCNELNGLVIPAHIDRPSFGVLGQLGFIPSGIRCHGWEISRESFDKKIPDVPGPLVCNSDAHDLADFIRPGHVQSWLYAQAPNFCELRLALQSRGGRKVVIGAR